MATPTEQKEEVAEKKKYNNLQLVLFQNQKKVAGSTSPDYFLKHKIADKKWSQLGVAWKNKNGNDSLQVNLDMDMVKLFIPA